jgi:hypothetical protein
MPKQNDLRDPRLATNEFDRCFHIERRFFPTDLAFIVLKSRIEAKREKAATGEFPSRDMAQVIRRAMPDDEGDVWRRPAVWLVEGRADTA